MRISWKFHILGVNVKIGSTYDSDNASLYDNIGEKRMCGTRKIYRSKVRGTVGNSSGDRSI